MNDYSKTVVLLIAIAAALNGCSAAREGMEAHKDAVARVDGHTLTVNHAAELLSHADENIAPADPAIVDPLSDLWIGYTILAIELASPDTFSNIDVTPIIQHELNQDLAWQLRGDAILAQVELSESELREAYEREQPYTRVEAQHILVAVTTGASAEEVDSLRRLAESLRERAVGGEDFGDLARAYSNDTTTARNGGSLGWLSSGSFYSEVEDAILRMRPGDISETVRSRRGYHIFKATDRSAPDLEEVREEFLRDINSRRIPDLERAYVDSLFRAADVQFAPGAVHLVRRMVYAPQLERLSAAQRATALVRYRGGRLTFGEWADFIVKGSSETRRAFAADSATVAGYLRELVRNELLVKAAHDLGYTVPEQKVDSLRESAIRELFTAAASGGMRRESLTSGAQTIPEAVDTALELLLTRRRSPAGLERVATALRQDRAIQFYPDRSRAVIDRLTAIRQQQAGRAGDTPAEVPRPE